MAFDVCMIILTAFAVFGGYCLVEMIADAMDGAKSPPSVTVLQYSEDDYAYKKVRYIYNNLYNNNIVFIGNKEENSIYPDSHCCEVCEISEYITDVLFTKKNG